MKEKVVIIGGGLGGLFSGALLAKNGLDVTVLEKNAIIGGGLQCFRRNGLQFETGMHVLGGFRKGGNLSKICNYLGILERLDIRHVPDSEMDEIHYRLSGDTYRIPSGRENFTAYFSRLFPDEACGIKEYVDELYRLTEEMPLFHLKAAPAGLVAHSEKFYWPADRLIAHYVRDERLRELLAYLNTLYGGIAGHTPAYVHALINVLYINGASRFAGGSQQLADALKDVIEANGGAVLSGKEVTRVELSPVRTVESVITTDGDGYPADWCVSAVHPVELLRMLPEGAFPKAFSRRLDEIPVSYSAFSLFIELKPGRFPYIDHSCWLLDDYGSMWSQHDAPEAEWPRGFLYMTPPDSDQGPFASRLLVHSVMDFSEVEKWKDTTVGHRGEDYEAWKQAHVEKILDKLCSIYPDFKDAIANVYSSSPLTIRDFYHTKRGAIFGYRKDSADIMLSRIPVYTKIKNLLLTGQNVNLHGICGVPLTAVTTAEAILGQNKIVNDINNAYKEF